MHFDWLRYARLRARWPRTTTIDRFPARILCLELTDVIIHAPIHALQLVHTLLSKVEALAHESWQRSTELGTLARNFAPRRDVRANTIMQIFNTRNMLDLDEGTYDDNGSA